MLRSSDACLEISLFFTNDQTLCEYNERYRNVKKPTNVLSFPLYTKKILEKVMHTSDLVMLGDIMFGFGVIEKEAQEKNVPLESHVTHLLLHGFFHLLGYDHKKEEEAIQMEELEIESMGVFGWENPYS